ncbi:hypothetical protein AB4Y36_22225 [Paraburkholderia sp. BR10936]|uniref:hypothetical protein n=1 Tax=Paraburkholderia sp. BR10936 TaxID=3236993 RepID=UPI0034D2A3EA
MTRKSSRLLMSLASVGVVAACGTTSPDSTPVADTWGQQMSKYNIFPVFPPRADVQVGDIFLTCMGDASTQDMDSITKRSVWLTSLYDVVDDDPLPKQSTSEADAADPPAVSQAGMLTREYRTRVEMPVIPQASAPIAAQPPGRASDTEDASAPKGASAPAAAANPGAAKARQQKKVQKLAKVGDQQGPAPRQQPKAGNADTPMQTLFSTVPPHQLKIVSFPEFFNVSLTKAQASALVPFPTIIAQAGFNYNDASNIQMSVPQAESYGVPFSEVEQAYRAQQDTPRMKVALDTAQKLAVGFCSVGVPRMLIVSEIYATRAIDVSITYSQSAGGGAQVGLAYDTGSKQATLLDAFKKYLGVGADTTNSGAGGNNGAGGAAKPVAKGAGQPDAASAPQPESQPTIAQATAFMQQLNDLSKQVISDQPLSFPGVQVSVFHGAASGVVMNRRFDSPVVIGFRGMARSFPLDDNQANQHAGSSDPVSGQRNNETTYGQRQTIPHNGSGGPVGDQPDNENTYELHQTIPLIDVNTLRKLNVDMPASARDRSVFQMPMNNH